MSVEVSYLSLMANGLVEGFIIGFGALAINLVFAVSRFPNAATGDFLTTGAYAGFGVQQAGSDNVFLQGLASVAACLLLSLASYQFVFRKLAGRPMVAFLLASIGIAFLVRSILTAFVGHEPLFFQLPIEAPIELFGIRIQKLDIWLCIVAIIVVCVVLAILHLSSIGKKMRAVADNPTLAQASGIRSREIMLTLWTLIGVVTGIAGLIFGMKATVHPELGWGVLLPSFAAAILGGVGSPGGAIVAGLVIGMLQELSTPWFGFSYKIALSFAVILFILLLRPQGLFGLKELVR